MCVWYAEGGGMRPHTEEKKTLTISRVLKIIPAMLFV